MSHPQALASLFRSMRAVAISTSDARRFVVERQEAGAFNSEINVSASDLKAALHELDALWAVVKLEVSG